MELVEFSISHFCEKSRWALDHKGIEYDRRVLVPLVHLAQMRQFDVTKTTVPILIDGSEAIQGTHAIVEYLDQKISENPLTPTDPSLRASAIELETEIDREVGEMFRRILYGQVLSDRKLLAQMWSQDGPLYAKPMLSVTFPVAKRIISKAYKVNPVGIARAEQRLDAILETLETRLAGSRWLMGDAFSRVDIALASLLAPLVMPEEHPYHWPQELPEDAAAFQAKYSDRPIFSWVADTYKSHRHLQ